MFHTLFRKIELFKNTSLMWNPFQTMKSDKASDFPPVSLMLIEQDPLHPPTHTHTPGRYINPSQFNPKSNYMDWDYVDKVIVCGRVRHTKQHQLTTSAFELVAFILVTYDRWSMCFAISYNLYLAFFVNKY